MVVVASGGCGCGGRGGRQYVPACCCVTGKPGTRYQAQETTNHHLHHDRHHDHHQLTSSSSRSSLLMVGVMVLVVIAAAGCVHGGDGHYMPLLFLLSLSYKYYVVPLEGLCADVYRSPHQAIASIYNDEKCVRFNKFTFKMYGTQLSFFGTQTKGVCVNQVPPPQICLQTPSSWFISHYHLSWIVILAVCMEWKSYVCCFGPKLGRSSRPIVSH